MRQTVNSKSNYIPFTKVGDNYRVRWDYKEIDDEYASWMYEDFSEQPDMETIKKMIFEYYNNQIDDKIINGFVWNEMSVKLSNENKFNYKAAYDLAIQTNGQSLPVTFKFGTDEDPKYHTFTTVEELNDFYIAATNYINATLTEGWVKKDSIDWSIYEINE